jgi:steroid 5-alpha reductase family enzyme
VIAAIAFRIGAAWLVCAAIQAVLWAISRRTNNAGIVDVGWALSFTAVVGVFGLTALGPPSSWLPIAVIVVVWSMRLGCYLIARGAATGAEEGRYVELRQRWAHRAATKFFVFFQAQGVLTAILSTAFVVPFVTGAWDNGSLRVLGLAIAAIGVAGETIADIELRRWKRDPANKGKVCMTGLWAYSRHPNYFFEWCVWLGYAVYGFAFPLPLGLFGLLGQAIILGSIFGVTGIPPTEAQSLRSKGDAYRAYQARVSRFIPMPPKRARPEA